MIWGYNVFVILGFEVCHFGLSAFVGWLAYRLTSTILFHTGLKDISPKLATYHLPLLVALSCAVLVHVLEDYTLNLF